MKLQCEINGASIEVDVTPRTTLCDCLRQQLNLTGTHAGCEHGVCGACTVIVDGLAVRSCLFLATQASGTSIMTVEGLARDDELSPLQIAFRRHNALQCGFCTSGMLMTLHALLSDEPAADDVGRVINPLTLHGQVTGAAVQGLGSVFSENLIYDANGQLLIGSLADYLIPLATDYPHIRAVTLEQFPSPNNPLGAKGAGGGGIIPVGGVVTNAIASALGCFGVQPRDLPLTPPRLWDLIQKSRPTTS